MSKGYVIQQRMSFNGVKINKNKIWQMTPGGLGLRLPNLQFNEQLTTNFSRET